MVEENTLIPYQKKEGNRRKWFFINWIEKLQRKKIKKISIMLYLHNAQFQYHVMPSQLYQRNYVLETDIQNCITISCKIVQQSSQCISQTFKIKFSFLNFSNIWQKYGYSWKRGLINILIIENEVEKKIIWVINYVF